MYTSVYIYHYVRYYLHVRTRDTTCFVALISSGSNELYDRPLHIHTWRFFSITLVGRGNVECIGEHGLTLVGRGNVECNGEHGLTIGTFSRNYFGDHRAVIATLTLCHLLTPLSDFSSLLTRLNYLNHLLTKLNYLSSPVDQIKWLKLTCWPN